MADDRPGAGSRIIRWIDYRLPFMAAMEHELYEYPTPRNLTYWWNFGSLAGIMLVVMIVTGIFLAMQYTPSSLLAFDSVERIMRDVNYGWLIRYAHANGASMFFAIVYIHIFPRALLRLVQGAARTVVDPRRDHPDPDDRHRVYGVRVALGADELLGRDRHHQSVFGDPAGRQRHRHFSVGRVQRRRPDLAPLLRAALSVALCNPVRRAAASGRAASLRLQQPVGHRYEGAAGFDPVPPVLHESKICSGCAYFC